MDYKEASAKYRKSWTGEKAGLAGDENYMDFSKLVAIGSGGPFRKVIAPAAISYNKMKNAIGLKYSFQVGDKTFRPLSIEKQICAKRTCDGKSKAKAGYSRHGWGRAIDFTLIGSAVSWKMNVLPSQNTDARVLFDWLCQWALNYGWINYLAEAWHWEYVGEPPGVYKNPVIKGNPDYVPTENDDNQNEESGSSNDYYQSSSYDGESQSSEQ